MSAVSAADVYKNGVLAARLTRLPTGVEFRYLDAYLADGIAIASTLPLTTEPTLTQSGAVPPFFAGLLPEGRRLSALRRSVKTSADDELSLLVAVGNDVVGDVQVVEQGQALTPGGDSLRIERSFDEVRFSDLIDESGEGGRPTLAGAQDKVSARMISVPLARSRSRYILKLNPPEYAHLVENEAFFLELARTTRMPVADAALVHDRDGQPGLLVTRFDRVWRDDAIRMLGVEDACQAMGLWPAEKYNVPMERAAQALLALTPARAVAAQNILLQVTYAWLTGNGDLHAKNLAVLHSVDAGVRMAPAYDLPSTLFYDDATLALTIGDADTLSARRLREFGRLLGVPDKAAVRAIATALRATDELGERIAIAELGFDRRIVDKVTRQLQTRSREIQRAID